MESGNECDTRTSVKEECTFTDEDGWVVTVKFVQEVLGTKSKTSDLH